MKIIKTPKEIVRKTGYTVTVTFEHGSGSTHTEKQAFTEKDADILAFWKAYQNIFLCADELDTFWVLLTERNLSDADLDSAVRDIVSDGSFTEEEARSCYYILKQLEWPADAAAPEYMAVMIGISITYFDGTQEYDIRIEP